MHADQRFIMDAIMLLALKYLQNYTLQLYKIGMIATKIVVTDGRKMAKSSNTALNGNQSIRRNELNIKIYPTIFQAIQCACG